MGRSANGVVNLADSVWLGWLVHLPCQNQLSRRLVRIFHSRVLSSSDLTRLHSAGRRNLSSAARDSLFRAHSLTPTPSSSSRQFPTIRRLSTPRRLSSLRHLSHKPSSQLETPSYPPSTLHRLDNLRRQAEPGSPARPRRRALWRRWQRRCIDGGAPPPHLPPLLLPIRRLLFDTAASPFPTFATPTTVCTSDDLPYPSSPAVPERGRRRARDARRIRSCEA